MSHDDDDDAWRTLPEPDPTRGQRDWLYHVITWGVGIAVPLAAVVGLALLVVISTRQHARPPDPAGRRFHALPPERAREHECWTDGVMTKSDAPCPPGSWRREIPAGGTEAHAPPSIELRSAAPPR
jgi:hypothetical protein